MKHMKKLLSLAMALAMVLALGVSASAATKLVAPTDPNGKTHTYQVYQILGAQLTEAKDSLTNFSWGAHVSGNEAGLIANLKTLDQFKDMADDADADAVAAILSTLTSNSAPINAVAAKLADGSSRNSANAWGIDKDLEAGYYLIVDTVEGTPVYHLYPVLGTEGTLTMQIKKDVPGVEKWVQAKVGGGWQTAADYQIGDTVPFKLVSTVPAKFDTAETYTITLHDKMEDGLEFNPESVTLKIVSADGTAERVSYTFEQLVASNNLIYNNLDDSCTFEIKNLNVKGIAGVEAGDKIVVEYNAKLVKMPANGEGAEGIKNKVDMDWKLDDETGTTPGNEVTVFTFQLIVNKTKGSDGTELDGAVFELFKQDGTEWVSMGVLGAELGEDGQPKMENGKYVSGNIHEFTFTSLDEGSYKLVEVQVPEGGYTKAPDLLFDVKPTYDIITTTPGMEAPELKGLKITIHNEDGTTTVYDKTEEGVTLSNAAYETDVPNFTGTTLPETGGIGTTIFYIVGGLLVAGAVILLITKRRMSISED